MVTRPPAGSVPDAPGSYQFVDGHGRVLYVGKAKSLRARLNSYFQDPAALPVRAAQMVEQADHVEWMVVDRESEALLLEHNLIQQHQPRYNVRLKDDKSYPWLAVTTSDDWPRPAVVRGRKRRGVRYFGPYPNVGAIRHTLDLLLRSFPVRTCSDTKFRRHERLGRPCLMYHIERCSGPCVGSVDHPEYDQMVDNLVDFLSGNSSRLERELEREMQAASAALEYERASVLRDKLEAVRAADAVRQMELARAEDLDVVAVAEDELEAAVQVFHVRSGKVVGRQSLFVDKAEDLTERRAHGPHPGRRLRRRPGRRAPPGAGSGDAGRRGGGDRLPGRATGRPGLAPGPANGVPSAPCCRPSSRTPTRRSSATGSSACPTTTAGPGPSRPSNASSGCPEAPLRIECYDMSHLQGSDYVGSMVVFEDGLAKKSDYRHFRVTTVPGNDDYAAMEEVLTRRLTSLVTDESDGAATELSTRSGDGGSPTRRSCCCSTVASVSSTSVSGCSSGWG